MQKAPYRFRIILVRPRNPGNIGAAARALANFGFDDLWIVDPHQPLIDEARAAPEAESVLLESTIAPTFEAALKGCDLVLGTSSFHQRRQEQQVIPLPDLAPWISTRSDKLIALVFGSERSGLSNSELTRCDAIVQIPTTPKTPSMNLAQAVAVALYELSKGTSTPRRAASLEQKMASPKILIEESIELAKAAGYPAGYPDAKRAGRFRQVLSDLQLREHEQKLLVSFIRWLKRKWS